MAPIALKGENSFSIDPMATGQYLLINHGWLDFCNKRLTHPAATRIHNYHFSTVMLKRFTQTALCSLFLLK